MTAQEYIQKFGVYYDSGNDELYDKDDCVVHVESDALEDLACPECGQRDSLRVVTETWVRIEHDRHSCECDCDYGDSANTECTSCNHEGMFHTFKITGLDRALERMIEDGRDGADADDEEDKDEEETPPPTVTIEEIQPPPQPPSEPIGWATDNINNQQPNT